MTTTVAVTGASGFIGRHLVDRLLGAGMALRVLSRRAGVAGLPEKAELISGSLEDSASLERLVQGVDAVVHCAGLVKGADQRELMRVNAAGTERLVRACAKQDPSPRLVFLSSLAARHPELSGYAASKHEAENVLARHAADLHWTVVRPPAVYGPGDRETLQFFRFMRSGLFPVPNVPAGARFSLVYVSDLCEALWALLKNPGASGAKFEVGDGCLDGYSWQALAEAGGRHFGRRIRCIPIPKWLMLSVASLNQIFERLTGQPASITSGKVRELFHDEWVCRDNALTLQTGWRPAVGLDEGVGLTIKWYKDNGWL